MRFAEVLFVLLWAATMEAIGLGVVVDFVQYVEKVVARISGLQAS